MATDNNNPDEEGSADDSGLRDQLTASGFKPDPSGVRFGPAQPTVLVAGAFKVIRTAAEKARAVLGRGKE